MSEHQTEVVKQGATIIDREMAPKDKVASALVVDQSGRVVAGATQAEGRDDNLMGFLSAMGFPVPIASPEQLRSAFEYQQRMYAAVLGESDYLYTVTYTSDNRQQNKVVQTLAEAQGLVDKFKNLGAVLNAKPKKSGIVKLARALGITATVKSRAGLPEDPTATYSFVEYEARHEGTGRSETGVGWCDLGERGGKISRHDVIATADTRAYNRAVLRLAGFGDVSAEEIIGGPVSGEDAPTSVPEKPRMKKAKTLPGIDTDVVVAACRAWAEAIASRSGSQFVPTAQQETRSAQEMRAKARRGDTKAATKLGAMGLRWDGLAIDGTGYQPFIVGMPSTTPEQVIEAREAMKKSAEPEQKKGWDLSAKGSENDDAPANDLIDPAPESEPSGDEETISVPQPSPAAETITIAQAKAVSTLLKALFTDKDDMTAWLRTHCHVDRTIHIRTNQYEHIMNALRQKKEAKANG